MIGLEPIFIYFQVVQIGLEPIRISPKVFKTFAATYYAIEPNFKINNRNLITPKLLGLHSVIGLYVLFIFEPIIGIEPMILVLQTSALPLDYIGLYLALLSGNDPETSDLTDPRSNQLSYNRIFVHRVGIEPTTEKI